MKKDALPHPILPDPDLPLPTDEECELYAGVIAGSDRRLAGASRFNRNAALIGLLLLVPALFFLSRTHAATTGYIALILIGALIMALRVHRHRATNASVSAHDALLRRDDRVLCPPCGTLCTFTPGDAETMCPACSARIDVSGWPEWAFPVLSDMNPAEPRDEAAIKDRMRAHAETFRACGSYEWGLFALGVTTIIAGGAMSIWWVTVSGFAIWFLCYVPQWRAERAERRHTAGAFLLASIPGRPSRWHLPIGAMSAALESEKECARVRRAAIDELDAVRSRA